MVLRLASPGAVGAAERVLEAEAAFESVRERALEAVRDLGRTNRDLTQPLRKTLRALKKGACPEDTGTVVDAHLAAMREHAAAVASARKAYAKTMEDSLAAVETTVRDLAGDARLRAAVTWQNRALLANVLDPILRAEGRVGRSRELLVARYVQRYCTKNDSIGFFGPVGWARWQADAPAFMARQGATLVASRSVHFEHWPIDVLAGKLSEDERFLPWIAPRRFPFVRIEGAIARSAATGKHELSAEEARLLASCDGVQTARQLAGSLEMAEPRVFDLLRKLRKEKLLAWRFEVPLVWNPDAALRRILESIEDDGLRSEALAPLDELDGIRRAVADRSEDATLLAQSLGDLDVAFTRITGAPPTREAGTTYAGRQLVYEDCTRDLDAAFGPDLLARLSGPLGLVLTSARWLTFELARVYRDALHRLHAQLLTRGRPVQLTDLWLRSQSLFFGSKERLIDKVVAELQSRWSAILGPLGDAKSVTFSAEKLRPAVDATFAAPGPGWTAACHQSPDIMIAATDLDAIRRGDYQLVLGELHAGVNALDTAVLLEMHPRRDELDDFFERDLKCPRIVPVLPKDWPGSTVRTNSPVVTSETRLLETGFDRAAGPRERVLAMSDLVVVEDGDRLVVRSHSGAPTMPPVEIVEFFGQVLTTLVASSFRMLPPWAHAPRVTIDDVVVSRERWTLSPADFTFADEADDGERLLEALRWSRRHALPRFFFVKSPDEVKPLFVDLHSPLYVAMLAKVARAASADLVLTEMLPTLDQLWLVDPKGERYTAELRMITVDGARL